MRNWRHEDDQKVCGLYGRMTAAAIAIEMGTGTTKSAIKNRLRVLGLKGGTDRFFSAEEKARVAELRMTHTAKEIAKIVFSSAVKESNVFALIKRMKLPRKWNQWSNEVLDEVRALNAKGLTDADIARRMNLKRDQIKEIRHCRLKLPTNIASVKAALRAGAKTQLQRLGLKNLAELRARAYRNYALQNGWPDDLRPRHVQILNLLAVQGPSERKDIARKIGWNPVRMKGPEIMFSNEPGNHTYLSGLIARGLVFSIKRFTSAGVRGGRRPNLYMLTELALASIEARLQQERKHAV